MLVRRHSFSAAYDDLNKSIYVFGGINNIKNQQNNQESNELNVCEKYSVEDNKWKYISSMDQPQKHTSACNFNNQFIYLIGRSINKYHIANDSWQPI